MLSYFFPCSFYASFNFPTFYNHFELTLPRCLLSCASTWRIEAKKDVLGNVNVLNLISVTSYLLVSTDLVDRF